MGVVIGIDPGNRTGVSVFHGATLYAAYVDCADDVKEKPPYLVGCTTIIEVPRIYPRGSKGDPNQLLDLSVFVGNLQGFYDRAGCVTRLVHPRTWKGTAPKAIHNKRIVAALTPTERLLLPRRPRADDFDHNMIDAVGLALFQLGRLRV